MTNREIAKSFTLLASLMELHGENPFKIKSYTGAAFRIERLEKELSELTEVEVAAMPGIGKAISTKIADLLSGNSIVALDRLLNQTPLGVLEMLSINGLGPRKVALLWKEYQMNSVNDLLDACRVGKLAGIKGFGAKTQENIRRNIEFLMEQASKYLYADLEKTAFELISQIRNASFNKAELTGEIRRKNEVLEFIEIIVEVDTPEDLTKVLTITGLADIKTTLAFDMNLVEGRLQNGIPVKLYFSRKGSFVWDHFVATGNNKHVQQVTAKTGQLKEIASEEAIYKQFGTGYVEPELRENRGELEKEKASRLIGPDHIKGVIHAHSTYSDGRHTLRQMAEQCISLGYEYLCISDHSKSAFYANGLTVDNVLKQHEEIDILNEELAPFKIFKGIESDILPDGSLDYDDNILEKFDFIIASVHSGLKMDRQKATERLLTAIGNPYTTILGHMTGRLLLHREGYPVDHEAIIKACAGNNVVIEINANPRRLDMDWRWVNLAMENDVLLALNPDAHSMEGIADIYYGVCVARKGGLVPENTINTFNREKLLTFFNSKKTNSVTG